MNIEKNEKYRARGIIFALVGGMLWGLSGVNGQFLFNIKEIEAPWFVTWRLTIAGFLMVAALLLRKSTRDNALAIFSNKKDVISLMIFSILGMAACQYSYFIAVATSNAGTATVLQYTAPVLIMIYVATRDRRVPTIVEIIALILAVIGTFLLATRGDLDNLAISKVAIFWGAMASLSLVCYSLLPVRIMDKYGTAPVLGWAMFISGIVTSFITKPWIPQGIWDYQTVLAAAAVIILGTILSFSLYLEGVRIIGAPKASLFAASEPVTATVAVAVFMNVSFVLMDIIGLILIVVAVAMLSIFKDKENS